MESSSLRNGPEVGLAQFVKLPSSDNSELSLKFLSHFRIACQFQRLRGLPQVGGTGGSGLSEQTMSSEDPSILGEFRISCSLAHERWSDFENSSDKPQFPTNHIRIKRGVPCQSITSGF